MKKKILLVTLVVCVLAMTFASATIAYFTDTKTATNTFTTGDIKITLSEADPANGNALTEVDGTTLTGFQYQNVYPSQEIAKNPTITNVSANDAAYVAAIITLDNGKTGNDAITKILPDKDAVEKFLVGGALHANGFTTKYVIGEDTITIYVLANAPLDKDAAIALFGSVKIPAKWDVAEMKIFSTLKITIKAYATQTAGFGNNAANAIQAAFGGGADSTNGDFAGYFN